MDAHMAAQEHVALALSLVELHNNRQSDPAWLEKCLAAFAADCEVVDTASETTFHGPEGYKRLMRFHAESFPEIRIELSNVLATEDQVVLECTWRGTNTGSQNLPTEAIPATGHAGELRLCHVMKIRNGKIVSLHCYYDLTTLLEQLGLNAATAEAM